MLIHHDSRPYAIAAAEASAKAKNKLEKTIDNGRASAAGIIDRVMKEVPSDMLVRGPAIDVESLSDTILASIPTPKKAALKSAEIEGDIPATIEEAINDTIFKTETPEVVQIKYKVHDHAMRQMAYRLGIPMRYISHLQKEGIWGHELLAHDLNEHFKHQISKRFLVRSYDWTVRGFLSDRYRRRDSRPLLEAFVEACDEIGAIPIDGKGTDVKVQLKAMIPIIFEPANNEVVAFYVTWSNSDYGAGAHEISAGILRLWCTNFAVLDTTMRNVHIGRRLSDDVNYSDKTYQLDTAATASAIKDTVKDVLSEKTTTQLCEVIKKSHEEEIDPQKAIAALKAEFTKATSKKVIDVFNSPDVEMLPPGNTSWRLSNAISFVAGQSEDVEEKMNLERIAGKAISWALGS